MRLNEQDCAKMWDKSKCGHKPYKRDHLAARLTVETDPVSTPSDGSRESDHNEASGPRVLFVQMSEYHVLCCHMV